MKTEAAVEQFLSQRRIAVTGVSRTPKDHGANVVCRRLRDRGYEVFAVNPHADAVEGDACYPDLRAIPGGAVPGPAASRRTQRTSAVSTGCRSSTAAAPACTHPHRPEA